MDFLSNTFLLHHQELHWKKKTFIRLLWWEICIPIFLRGERKKEKDVAIIRVFHRRIFQGHTSLMVSLNACINQGKRRFHIYSSGQILERENSGLVLLLSFHCSKTTVARWTHFSMSARIYKKSQSAPLIIFLSEKKQLLARFFSFFLPETQEAAACARKPRTGERKTKWKQSNLLKLNSGPAEIAKV